MKPSDEIKKTETPSGTPATQNVQREMAKTSRQPGDGVGDTPQDDSRKVTVKSDDDKDSGLPKGVNKGVWAQAEHNARNRGGFAGLDDQGRTTLIQEQYDQLVENDEKTKRWGGKDGVLGDAS